MNVSPFLDSRELEGRFSTHVAPMFRKGLNRIASNDDLLRVLANFVVFNAPFASGVTNLVGSIAARPDLFRDPDDDFATLADRNSEVAAAIFLTAIGEFAESGMRSHCTHRTLAQATLRAASEFFGYTPQRFNQIASVPPSIGSAITALRHGYGMDRVLDAPGFLRCIGFHLGSEMLAHKEFETIDQFLRERYPCLVDHLTGGLNSSSVDGHSAYYWIALHTSIELEHFRATLIAADLAIKYYTGPESMNARKALILDGVQEFVEVESTFLKHLADSVTIGADQEDICA